MSNYTEDDIKQALSKKALFGSDIDLEHYDDGDKDVEKFEKLDDVSDELRKDMLNVGVVDDNDLSTLIFTDNGLSHCSAKQQEGLIMMTTQEALEKYSWVRDYYWNVMDPTKDKYTAKTYAENSDGYFIYVKPGYHLQAPVQTCMMLSKNKSVQNLHNIIIVGDNASIDMVTGCTTVHHANDALHVGVSEMYIGNNSSLKFTMVHSWGTQTAVRPRTNIIMGENANYTNNYVVLDPVGTIQSCPTAYLNGDGAKASFNTMCIAHENSNIDTGGNAILNGRNSGAEIISRNISYGGKMIARGLLEGNAPGVKAHLECKSIILKDGGYTHAIPELASSCADVEMTHEAAVGKIAQDQIDYLMTRGLSEDEAVSMIVRGFLVGGISGLPDNLQKDIDAAIEKANEGD
ncbi:MAG: SufD family Fe-S cluster assembly protein [archaeon]|nr:SufD family Fe-S cluster assembly protein [archaeon]